MNGPSLDDSRWINDAYCIDVRGFVWSRKPRNGRGDLLPDTPGNWRPVKQRADSDGYQRVGLWIGGRQLTLYIHRLLYSAFIGAIQNDMQVCHNDGNPQNNSLQNLRVDTPCGNQRDRIAHGTDCRGEKCGNSKLSAEQVRAIRVQLLHGGKEKDIASDFGVHRSTINLIKLKKTWAGELLVLPVHSFASDPASTRPECERASGDDPDECSQMRLKGKDIRGPTATALAVTE